MKYRKFYIQYNPYVVFTADNGKTYTRRLYEEGKKLFINFNNKKVEILQEQIYM